MTNGTIIVKTCRVFLLVITKVRIKDCSRDKARDKERERHCSHEVDYDLASQ